MQANNKDEDDDRQSINAMPQITDGKWTHEVYAAVVEVPTKLGRIYTNQSGWFSITSWQGNKYLMVLYDYDSSAIIAEPLKRRTDIAMVEA
jgi:hypothetical protein